MNERRQSPQKRAAVDWLRGQLSAGRVPSTDIKQRGREGGLTEKTLRWAADQLNARIYAEGFGRDC